MCRSYALIASRLPCTGQSKNEQSHVLKPEIRCVNVSLRVLVEQKQGFKCFRCQKINSNDTWTKVFETVVLNVLQECSF